MLALVTGATGFLGSHICRMLLEAGHGVRAFHRPSSRLALLEGLTVQHAIGDVTDGASLEAAMHGVDAVFHAAAKVDYWRDSRGMYEITVGGTTNVLRAAMASGVKRVVHISSVAALGVPEDVRKYPSKEPTLLNETHVWNYKPQWWRYGHAKHLSEREVQKAVAEGLDVVILNPASIYGPGDINRVSGDLIIQVAKGRLPFALEGGMNVVDVRDVAYGALAAYERGKCGERYIIGGENLTHSEFVTQVAEIVGRKPPGWIAPTWLVRRLATPVDWLSNLFPLPTNGDLLRFAGLYFYYDTSKARHELGLSQPRSARTAAEDTYHWYRERGMV